jgi:hypothetical protein
MALNPDEELAELEKQMKLKAKFADHYNVRDVSNEETRKLALAVLKKWEKVLDFIDGEIEGLEKKTKQSGMLGGEVLLQPTDSAFTKVH